MTGAYHSSGTAIHGPSHPWLRCRTRILFLESRAGAGYRRCPERTCLTSRQVGKGCAQQLPLEDSDSGAAAAKAFEALDDATASP
jgi:hypothetical protein